MKAQAQFTISDLNDGAAGNSITKITPEYYLSSMSTSQVDGNWQQSIPQYKQGYYYWKRERYDWSHTTTPTYSTVVLDNSLNGAYEKATSALVSADSKNTVFYLDGKNNSNGVPTVVPTGTTAAPLKVNDLWFNTGDGNCSYRWNGTQWEKKQFGSAAIDNLDAGKITTGTLLAERIGALSITASKIATGAVTTDKLSALAVTSDKINVNNLSAINANLGDVSVGGQNNITGSIGFFDVSNAKFGSFDNSGIELASSDDSTRLLKIGSTISSNQSTANASGFWAGRNYWDIWRNNSSGKLIGKVIAEVSSSTPSIGITDSNNSYVTQFTTTSASIGTNINMASGKGIYNGASYILKEHGNGNVSINACNINTGILYLGYADTSVINMSAPLHSPTLVNNHYLRWYNQYGKSTWQIGLSNGDNAHLFSQGGDGGYTGSLTIGHLTNNGTYISGRNVQLIVADDGSPRLACTAVYERTYSSGATVTVTSAGTLGRISSASKYKLDITESNRISNNILSLTPKMWFDRTNSEMYADALTMLNSGEITEEEFNKLDIQKVERQYGLIAEELETMGLSHYCIYNTRTGEVEGIQYDRMWIDLIPIMKGLTDRVNEIESKITS